MIKLSDIGIEDCIRSEEKPDKLCMLKIKGEYKEFEMVTGEHGWLEVVMSLEGGISIIPLLDINIMLGRA